MSNGVSRRLTAASLAAVTAIGWGMSATAQDGAWDYTATVYLFTAATTTGISGPMGGIETTLSFGDALSNLDFAFMGTFEASNGSWSVIADYLYTDLSFTSAPPGPAFTGADTSVVTQVLSGYLIYRVFRDDTVDIDVGAGARWFSADAGIALTGGPGPTPSRTFEDSWIDPLIAARITVRLAPRWHGTAALDYGGFTGDSETWQVLLTAGYEINPAWSIRGGYRYLAVDRTTDGKDFSFSQSGPVLGLSYRF